MQGKLQPLCPLALPIKGMLPILAEGLIPAIGQPEFGAGIAAILDKLQIFTIGDEPTGQGEGLHQHLVAWPLVVEGKALGRIMAEGFAFDNKGDRKSTRLNSSHVKISYAVFCLKKKK